MIQGNGLQGAYSSTLARIKAQKGSKSKLGMQALMWLSHSERSLNVSELCHALGVEIGTTDLNSRNIPAIETLLGCSLGLVTVEASTYTVRLVHRTLQEYLSDNRDLFHSPHVVIAEACLTYLNFQYFRDFSPTHRLSEPEAPLLKYASCYWATHARREMTESLSTLALKLLDGFEKHVSSEVLLFHFGDNWNSRLRRSDSRRFTGLHGAAYLEIVEIVVALLKMKKWDLDATDIVGNTPILWAAIMRHSAVLKVLLEQGATPNTADRWGRTPLSWAAEYKDEDVVKILLEREDVTPNTADGQGKTPLLLAVANRHENIVKMLLGRQDVTPDTQDRRGRTPLLWAAENGYGAIVKILLGRQDITPDIPDGKGRTPLSRAAKSGFLDIVAMLLDREDVTPDTVDKDGRTPLFRAAENGCEYVMEMLLERGDVTPNIADKDGRTPLLWAAKKGDRSIVKLLLEWDHVTPNTPDDNGRTSLSWAAENGHRAIVNMLLERQDITPDSPDEDGRTPLSWAAENGREDIVAMLLKREDVTPITVDKDSRTPLLWAAENGYEDIVAMLLEREDIASDTTDKGSQTAFSWAAECGAEQLLERASVSRHMATTETASQTALRQTSEKQPSRAPKRRLENQGSVPQLAGSNNPIDLIPAGPSEPSQCPPKRIRRS